MATEVFHSDIQIDSLPPARWRWFMGVGAALVFLGIVAWANLALATLAATYALAATLFAGGVLMLVHAVGVGRLGVAALWAILGVIYVAGAVFLFARPTIAIALLTMWFAALFMVSGAMRLVIAATRRLEGWGWLVTSGVFGISAGVLIALGWPLNAVWVLGLLLAIDLFVQGSAFVLIGARLRTLASPHHRATRAFRHAETSAYQPSPEPWHPQH
jgi:uncharacterized membrane protein HdeD (DUF308 family)